MSLRQEIANSEAGLYDSLDQSTIQSESIARVKKDKIRAAAERKASRLGLKSKYQDVYNDADSSDPLYNTDGVVISQGIRLKGGDSPEVFHDIVPTGDSKNERSKVYKQVAEANGLTLEEAVQLVDNQAEAYKIDQEYRASKQFQIDKQNNPNDIYNSSNNLSDAIANLRQQHITGKDYNIQSYDIYNAGDKATEAARIDSQSHPVSKLENSRNYLTGELDVFGRELSNTPYTDRQIAAGYMDAGSTDRATYEKQLKLQANAKAKGLGNYGSNNVDPRVMDLIHDTSYAKFKYDNPNFVDNSSIDVNDIKDGVLNIGTTIVSTFPELADVGMEVLIGLNHMVGDPVGLDKMSNVELVNYGMKKAKDGTVKAVLFDNGKEYFDKLVGINSKKLTSGQKQITERIYKIYEDDKLSKIEKTKRMFQVMEDNVGILPQLIGGVYGFMKQMALGGTNTLITAAETGKLAKVADILGIADKSTKAERVAKATKLAENSPKLQAKLDSTIANIEKRFAGDKVGVTAAGMPFATITTNDILEARHENNVNDGTDNYSNPFEVFTTAITSYGINSIDLMTDKFAISPKAGQLVEGVTKMFAKDIAASTDKLAAKELLKSTLAFVASASGKMTESAVVEGSTEGLQQAIQIYAEKYGTDGFKDKEFAEYYDNEAVKSIIGSTAIGSFAGVGLKGGSVVLDAGKNAIGVAKDVKDAKSTNGSEVGIDKIKDYNKAANKVKAIKIISEDDLYGKVLDGTHEELNKEELLNGRSGEKGLVSVVTDLEDHLASLETSNLDEAATKHKKDVIDAIVLGKKMVGVLNGTAPLGNRAPDEVAKDIAEIEAKSEATKEDTAKLEQLKAEKLVSEFVQDNNLGKVAASKGKATSKDSLRLKLFGGTYNGERLPGILDYVSILNDPNSSSEFKELMKDNMAGFLKSQDDKFDAFDNGRKKYEIAVAEAKARGDSQEDISKISIPVAGAREGDKERAFTSNTYPLYNDIKRENDLLTEIVDKFIYKGSPESNVVEPTVEPTPPTKEVKVGKKIELPVFTPEEQSKMSDKDSELYSNVTSNYYKDSSYEPTGKDIARLNELRAEIDNNEKERIAYEKYSKENSNGKGYKEAKGTTTEKVEVTKAEEADSGKSTKQTEKEVIDNLATEEEIQELSRLEAEIADMEDSIDAMYKELKSYGVVNGGISIEARVRNLKIQVDRKIAPLDEKIKELNVLLKPTSNLRRKVQGIIDEASNKISRAENSNDTKELNMLYKGIVTAKDNLQDYKVTLDELKTSIKLNGTVGKHLIASTSKYPTKNKTQAKASEGYATKVLSKEQQAESDKLLSISLGTYFKPSVPKGHIEYVGLSYEDLLEATPKEVTEKLIAKNEDDEGVLKVQVKLATKVIGRVHNSVEKIFLHDAKKVTNLYDISENPDTRYPGFQSVSRLLKWQVPVERNEGKPVNEFVWATDPAVMKAIATVASKWLTVDAADSRKEMRSDDDIRSLLGRDKKHIISEEDREIASKFDGMLNQGIDAMGSEIYNMLGLTKQPHEVGKPTERIEAKMKIELGILGMMALEDSGLVVMNNKSRTKEMDGFVDGFKTPSEVIFGAKATTDNDIPTYTITSKNKAWYDKDHTLPKLPEAEVLPSNIRGLGVPITGHMIIGEKKATGKAIESLVAMVGEEAGKTGPYFTKGENKTTFAGMKNQGVSKLVGEAPLQNKLAIEKQEDTASTLNLSYVRRLEDMMDRDSGRVLKAFGWKDPERVHVSERSSTIGRNNEIERDFTHLAEVVDEGIVNDNEPLPMWFKWYIVTNGRFGIKSNTFNIQDVKLHRNAVDSQIVEVTKGSEEDIIAQLAIAQGLDIDVDKQTSTTSLVELDEVIDSIVKGLGYAPKKDRKKALDTMYTDDAEFMKGFLWISKNITNDTNMPHALRSYTELLDRHTALQKGTVYKTGIRLETDAITSGYILKMMMMPIFKTKDGGIDMSKIFDQLKKGGVFTKDDWKKLKSFENMKENTNVLDAYEYPADIASKKISKPVDEDGNELIGEEKTKKLVESKAAIELLEEKALKDGVITIIRNMMKNPFMVFNYGSGLTSIITGMVNGGVGNIYSRLTDAGDVDSTTEVRWKKLAIVTNAILAAAPYTNYNKIKKENRVAKAQKLVDELNSVMDSDLEGEVANILNFKVQKEVEVGIGKLIKATVNKPIRDTFQEAYGEYMEAATTLNSSFSMMFRLVKPKLDKRLDERTTEWNNENGKGNSGRYTPLPAAEVEKVIFDMRKELPILELALADENDEKSYALLSKNKSTEYTSEIDSTINSNSVIVLDGDKRTYGQSKLYGLVESYSSGAVIPIHFLDGMTQAQVLSKFKALGVHDANLFDVANAIEGTKEYNKAIWELTKKYSLTTSVVESVNNTLQEATSSELIELDKKYLKDFIVDYVNNRMPSEYSDEARAEGISNGDIIKYIVDEATNEIVNNDIVELLGRLQPSTGKVDKSNEVLKQIILGMVDYMNDEGTKPVDTVRSVYRNIVELQKTSEKGREGVFNGIGAVEHSALEGSGYDGMAGEAEYVAKVPSNNRGKATDSYFNITVQSSSNIKEGIITELNSIMNAKYKGKAIPNKVVSYMQDVLAAAEEGC